MLGYVGTAFTAISKDLQLGYQMWFLLPNEERDLKSVISDPEVLQFLSNPKGGALEEYDVNLGVPRFDISCKLDMKPIMQSMGICSVFDESSGNFSPITNAKGLRLSTALHNTQIKVWEEGVEAASFIELAVAAACTPKRVKEIDFILNRPFLFVITKACRIPMYIGMVVNPQEKESVQTASPDKRFHSPCYRTS